MANLREGRELPTIMFLCMMWYLVSSSANIVGKTLLLEFPYPMTATMVQLTSITVLSGPVFRLMNIRRTTSSSITWTYYGKLIVPLAMGKFLGSVLSHVSIWKVPVSYTHTVKAIMPLFTVILSRVILHEKQTWKVYLSLLPIVCGVAIASLTELSFNFTGLLSALASTLAFSLQNIYSKKVLRDTGIHHLRLLLVLGRLALFMFLPIWLVTDLQSLLRDPATNEPVNVSFRTLWLLVAEGVLNWLQNIIAFSVLSLVTPLTYAVASASKRIFVISVTLFILGNPVTGLNVFGMVLAIVGVLVYNKAKYDQRMSEKKLSLLPIANKKPSNGNLLFAASNGWVKDTQPLFVS